MHRREKARSVESMQSYLALHSSGINEDEHAAHTLQHTLQALMSDGDAPPVEVTLQHTQQHTMQRTLQRTHTVGFDGDAATTDATDATDGDAPPVQVTLQHTLQHTLLHTLQHTLQHKLHAL